MSEEEISNVLADAQRRHIAKFCVEPHSSNEIFKSARTVWSDYSGSTLASDLKQLENSRAIAFAENKWKTTETAKKVLKKYFGF